MPKSLVKDDSLLALVNEFFVDGGPFTKDLGIRIESVDGTNARLSFPMQNGLIGLYRNPMLHGGVISSVLDVAGGVVVFLSVIDRLKGSSLKQKSDKLQKLNTIDLRIDYLRPGIGELFSSTGYILRSGNKVAVARMELHNEKQDLIAVGTGSYSFSFK